MNSKAMQAFLDQSDIDDEKADLNKAARERIHEQNMEKAMKHLMGSKPSMSEAINAPTKVEVGSLDDKTEPHEKLKNCDHSSEIIRDWKNPDNNTH